MPKSNEDVSLLEQLVTDLIKRVDGNYSSTIDKMDYKVDNLEKSMCEELRLLRKDVTDRISVVEEKLDSQDKRIYKIEHNWATFTSLVTVMSAFLVWLVNHLGHFFGIK